MQGREYYTLEELYALMGSVEKQLCQAYNAGHHTTVPGRYAMGRLEFLRPESTGMRALPNRVYSLNAPDGGEMYLVVFSNYNIQMYVSPVLCKNITRYDNWDTSLFRLHADCFMEPTAWRLHRFYAAPSHRRLGLGNLVLREFLHILPADTRRIVIKAQATHRVIHQKQLMGYYSRELMAAGYSPVAPGTRESHFNMDFTREL